MTVIENMLIANVHPGERVIPALKKGLWMIFRGENVERAWELLKFLKLDHLWGPRRWSDKAPLNGGP